MMHLVRVILLLTVFLIPLLSATPQFEYEQIKVLFFISLISLAAFLWMLSKKKKSRGSLITKAGGLFIGALFITSVLGTFPERSFLGAQPYFQGFILYAYLFLFFMLVRDSKIKIEIWTKVLVSSALVVSFIAIRQWIEINLLNLSIPTYAGRVVSSFGQPNFYAGFLLLTLPFTYKKGRFGILAGIILMTGIFVSYSRLTIILSLLLLILALLKEIKIKFKFTAVLAVFLISIFISLKFSSGIIWKEGVEPNSNKWLIENSPEKRIFIWPVVGSLVLEKPVAGYGLETMREGFSNFFKKLNFNVNSVSYYYSLKDITIDRSHNYILDLLYFSGILGLSAWVFLIVAIFRKMFHCLNGRPGNGIFISFISIVIYLVWVQFQNQSIVHLLYFWLLAGIIDQE